jgi:pimeloyl-ACP methyl ester carboxylesterase
MAHSFFIHSTGAGPFLWDGVPDDITAGTVVHKPANIGYPPNEMLARGTKVTAFDDVEHLFKLVPNDGEPVHLYAHSYGGFVAMELAKKLGARVASMFLYEPVLFGALAASKEGDPAAIAQAQEFLNHEWFLKDEQRGGTDAWLEHFIDYWNRPGSWQRMNEFMRGYSLAVGWKMFQEVRSVFHDNQRFDAFTFPQVKLTLGMGERSPVASREMVRQLSLVNPHAKVLEVAGTGHLAPLTHAAKLHETMRAHSSSP